MVPWLPEVFLRLNRNRKRQTTHRKPLSPRVTVWQHGLQLCTSLFFIDLVHLYNQSYIVDLNRAQPKLTFHLFDNLILIC